MIVKMTILRLLGSSDDKEKIGVARPEGLETSSVQRTRIEETVKKSKSKKSRHRYFSWSTPGSLVSPVEPTLGKLRTSVQWTQKLRQGLYTG